jgi:hypothetical protein
MLIERIDQFSLMNYSLVTTLKEGYLNYFATTFFFSFSWTGCGFEESTNIFSFDKGN